MAHLSQWLRSRIWTSAWAGFDDADREIWRHLDGHKVVVPCRASLPTSVAKTAMRTLVTDDSSLTSES